MDPSNIRAFCSRLEKAVEASAQHVEVAFDVLAPVPDLSVAEKRRVQIAEVREVPRFYSSTPKTELCRKMRSASFERAGC